MEFRKNLFFLCVFISCTSLDKRVDEVQSKTAGKERLPDSRALRDQFSFNNSLSVYAAVHPSYISYSNKIACLYADHFEVGY